MIKLTETNRETLLTTTGFKEKIFNFISGATDFNNQYKFIKINLIHCALFLIAFVLDGCI